MGRLLCLLVVASLTIGWTAVAVADDPLISKVQQELASFGYNPGPIDGVMGRMTREALASFSRDTDGSGSGEIDLHVMQATGLMSPNAAEGAEIQVEANLHAHILTIGERAEVLNDRLAGMTAAEIVEILPELYRRSLNKIDLVFERPKSIVFIIYSPLKPGDVVKTFHAHVIDGDLHPWRAIYEYPVLADTPVQPLIIINEFETSNPMVIRNAVLFNDQPIAVKHTRAAR